VSRRILRDLTHNELCETLHTARIRAADAFEGRNMNPAWTLGSLITNGIERALNAPAAPPQTTRVAVAEEIARGMGHERCWDSPDCADDACGHPGGHPSEPGCDACAGPGWPCETALATADAVLALLPYPRAVRAARGTGTTTEEGRDA
jgi:hypothetical protein